MECKAAIFDIDNTLADNRHRKHLIDPKNWEPFHQECLLDTPIVPMIKLLKLLNETHVIFLCTSRPEYVREKTRLWMKDHTGITFTNTLLMRAEMDHSPSSIIKAEMVAQIAKNYSIEFAFDDHDGCLDMYFMHNIFPLKPFLER